MSVSVSLKFGMRASILGVVWCGFTSWGVVEFVHYRSMGMSRAGRQYKFMTYLRQDGLQTYFEV